MTTVLDVKAIAANLKTLSHDDRVMTIVEDGSVLDLLLDAILAPPATEPQIAERLARTAHAGQKDPVTGDEYITHVERVVALVEGDQAKAVAWLHDVLEDTDLSVLALTDAGISQAVLEAVCLLTRDGVETYGEYIEALVKAKNPLAITVKLADLRDHLQPTCPERLRPRYERALELLAPLEVHDDDPAARVAHGVENSAATRSTAE